MIRALTFDLWDTIIADNSDEPKRAAQGLRSKHDERRYLVWQALDRVDPIPLDEVRRAYDVMEAAFNYVWREQHVTWTVPVRMRVLLDGLGRTLPDPALAEVIRAHEEMEVTVAPDPIDGAAAGLARLAADYKLAIISDAIVSPGRCLRRWLEMHDMLQHFSGFSFSDEVGFSKPHPRVFEAAAEQLDVRIDEMVHIGDRDHNDIKGAQALGIPAVLFTATRDRDKDITTADAICASYDALPETIERLAAKASGR